MPTKQPTADDNFMPFLDKPSIYVGMWGQGNNPDFKVDSSAFDAWTVENSANH